MKFPYVKLPSFDPRRPWVIRPLIPVVIEANHQTSPEFLALLDSGADRCLFHADIARALGLSMETGVRHSFAGIEGGKINEKPFDPQRLLVTVKNALDKSRLEQDQKLFVDDLMTRFGIVGVSQEMRRICAFVNRIARAETPVLITGENGVGKELIARAIHTLSGRKAFVPVNSAAVPKDLIESELFGHKRGAFTGAIADRIGKFRMADGGTLFLNEVGDMCPDMQAKLLRAIETKEITAVGSTHVETLDVRIIAATNQNLQKKMESGMFREDLFYRLRGVSIHVPPLRERRDDIPVLAEYFLTASNEGKEQKHRFSPQALEALKQHDWHGNVRELKYFVETLCLFADEEVIDHLQVFSALRWDKDDLQSSLRREEGHLLAKNIQSLRQYEQELIQKTLTETSGNITKAAELLKIDRTTLSKKIKRLGLGRR